MRGGCWRVERAVGERWGFILRKQGALRIAEALIGRGGLFGVKPRGW